MNKRLRSLVIWMLSLCMLLMTSGCGEITKILQSTVSNRTETAAQASDTAAADDSVSVSVKRGESYSSKDEVAAYLHEFGELPPNYISKNKAQNAGWDSSKGNLWDVADGCSIGGSNFGNYEGRLPKKDGRKYFECDIDYQGGFRNSKRIVYSNDGLIFYTEDHYETFEQLY